MKTAMIFWTMMQMDLTIAMILTVHFIQLATSQAVMMGWIKMVMEITTYRTVRNSD